MNLLLTRQREQGEETLLVKDITSPEVDALVGAAEGQSGFPVELDDVWVGATDGSWWHRSLDVAGVEILAIEVTADSPRLADVDLDVLPAHLTRIRYIPTGACGDFKGLSVVGDPLVLFDGEDHLRIVGIDVGADDVEVLD